MKPVNLLFLDASRGLYGASRMLLTLLSHLDRKSFKPYVLLANDVTQEEVRFPAELDRLNISYEEANLCVLRRAKYLNPRGLLWLSRTLVRSIPWLLRLVREKDIQLIATNTSTVLSGAIVAAMAGTPHVWMVHEIFRWEGWILSPFIYAFSTRITASSEAVAESWGNHFPWIRSKVDLIEFGMDSTPFAKVSSQQREALRKEFGIGSEDQVVTMVGRIGAWKGENFFVDMADQVVAGFPRVKFLIVGGVFDGNYQHLVNLRNKIQQLGLAHKIVVTGFRSDVPAILSCSDIFVLPSMQPEPFGMVLLEAMAAGKPVIATNHGGPRKIIGNSVEGFLVDFREPTEMAGRVTQLLQDADLRLRMGRAGLQTIRRKFSPGKAASRYQEIFRDILGLPPFTNHNLISSKT
jgi:glycosyltransferase involved in cell wall biosynthesis